MDPGLLPVYCCQCHEPIDAVHRPAAALPCDCLVALCVQCARQQLDDCHGYSYESLYYSCPICTEQATAMNGGFLKLNDEQIETIVDPLVSAAQFRLEGKWPRRSCLDKANLRGLMKKFASIRDLEKLVNPLLTLPLWEVELRTCIARLEWLLQNPSADSKPPYTRLPWGSLDHVEITLNRWLPMILTDPESVQSECMVCCDTLEPDKTVLYGCSCICTICSKCALVQCQYDANTFHDGLKCVMCKFKARHLLHNVNEAKELEVTLFKAAVARLRGWGFTYSFSDRYKQFAAKFIQAFQLYFLNDTLPEGCQLPSEEECQTKSFQALKLQLCRMEEAAQLKESNYPCRQQSEELPFGPLKPLRPRCNPFLSFYLRHAPEIGIQIADVPVEQTQTTTNLMRTKEDFLRRDVERKLLLKTENQVQQQMIVRQNPVFGEKYLATKRTPCPECSIDPRNTFLLHRHLFCRHEREEYAPQEFAEQIEIYCLEVDLTAAAEEEGTIDDGTGTLGEDDVEEVAEVSMEQETLDGNESDNGDSSVESIEFIETPRLASNSRPALAAAAASTSFASRSKIYFVEEGEILDEVPTGSSSSAPTALPPPPQSMTRPFTAVALAEGKAAAVRVLNLRHTQLSGVYELRLESPTDEHDMLNDSTGFNDFRLRYEIHLNAEDTTRFRQRANSSAYNEEGDEEVLGGEVQVHTDLCPLVQIRLGLKLQAGFTGMINKYFFNNREVQSKKTLGNLDVPRLSRLIIRPKPTEPWQTRPYRPSKRLPWWLKKREGHVTKAMQALRFAEELKKKRLEEEALNPQSIAPAPKVIMDSYEQALMESDSDDDCGGKRNKKKRKKPQEVAPKYEPSPFAFKPRPPASNPAPPPLPAVIADSYEQALVESEYGNDDDYGGRRSKKKRKQPPELPPKYEPSPYAFKPPLPASHPAPPPPPPPPPPRLKPPAPPRPPPPPLPLPSLPGSLSQRLGPSVQEETVSWQEDRRRRNDDNYDFGRDQHSNRRRRDDDGRDDRGGNTSDHRGPYGQHR